MSFGAWIGAIVNELHSIHSNPVYKLPYFSLFFQVECLQPSPKVLLRVTLFCIAVRTSDEETGFMTCIMQKL